MVDSSSAEYSAPRGDDPRGAFISGHEPFSMIIRYFTTAGNRGSFFNEYSTMFVAIFVASSDR